MLQIVKPDWDRTKAKASRVLPRCNGPSLTVRLGRWRGPRSEQGLRTVDLRTGATDNWHVPDETVGGVAGEGSYSTARSATKKAVRTLGNIDGLHVSKYSPTVKT
jgi:hypothetical protein